jgi:DNA-directed RNA polymerase specialized sigma24 family protein
MRRLYIDHLRKKPPLVHIPWREVVDGRLSPEEQAALNFAVHSVQDQLKDAHPDWREVVEYKFYGQLTNGAIAEILGVSEPTVERMWRKARY